MSLEAMLLGAFEVMASDGDRPPPNKTIERLVDLYDAWDKLEGASSWRARLASTPGNGDGDR